MEINDTLIDKLSSLARLSFKGEERLAIKDDLHKMIRFIDKLNELDTTDVAPLLHITENKTALRMDIVTGTCTRQEGLMNAGIKDEIFFKVPKVINNG